MSVNTNLKAGWQPCLFPEINTANPCGFRGTQNPRHLRTLIVLMHARGGFVRREVIDQIAGASNGPEIIAELRRRGLQIPCIRLHAIDRDGHPCRPGAYHLTPDDFKKIDGWIEGNPLLKMNHGKRA